MKYISEKMKRCFYRICTLVSPELNSRIIYRNTFHRQLNLETPTTYNEKLMWLKLNRYSKDPLVIQCADKYRVREYVAQCGCADILNQLYGVYDSVEDIPWEELPNQFVLKWNFGAGMNVICLDKSQMKKEEVFAKMRKWGKKKYWLLYSEMQYKYIVPKIICERLLGEVGENNVSE